MTVTLRLGLRRTPHAQLATLATIVPALVEPARAPLLGGAVLIVAGGVALLGEKARPAHFRLVGLAYAGLAMTLFASRDNLVRRLSETAGVARPGVAAATTLLTGMLLALVWFALARARPR